MRFTSTKQAIVYLLSVLVLFVLAGFFLQWITKDQPKLPLADCGIESGTCRPDWIDGYVRFSNTTKVILQSNDPSKPVVATKLRPYGGDISEFSLTGPAPTFRVGEHVKLWLACTDKSAMKVCRITDINFPK